jgi:hypothetical protein
MEDNDNPIIIRPHIVFRDRPFNLKGTWKGGYGFFLKQNIQIPNVAEKNIQILVEKKIY